jgi:hypothetical protein
MRAVFCILYVTNPFFCHEASVRRGTFAVGSLTPCLVRQDKELSQFVNDNSSCAFRLFAGVVADELGRARQEATQPYSA